MRKGGRTDMTKLIVAFLKFAKVPTIQRATCRMDDVIRKGKREGFGLRSYFYEVV
jgi:hypothetical protein